MTQLLALKRILERIPSLAPACSFPEGNGIMSLLSHRRPSHKGLEATRSLGWKLTCMSGDDATPSYRGYRHQALYILSRILDCADDSLVFQPEGKEDLAILDSRGAVVEAVQVKSLSERLALSSFSPSRAGSFFHRIATLLSEQNAARVTIASFGPIGPELDAAFRCEGAERDAVRMKLREHGLEDDDIRRIFDRSRIAPVAQADLRAKIAAFLRDSLLGGDPKHAFDLLQKWLYDASEKREPVTRSSLRDKVNAVGRYLHERAQFHRQWFSTIKPIEQSEITPERREELATGFYEGVAAQYDHIVIDADVKRTRWLNEVHASFETHRIVIVHGASGQGKSTLAYRYLHDSVPMVWRYEIRHIENRRHALEIATALSGHAKAIGSPVCVYIDARPGDTTWTTLVSELEQFGQLRVLVTVREEDWRRASLTSADFPFGSVDLTLDASEAREIYGSLVARSPPPHLLSFEEAWRRFRENGPLLEFVHLVSRSESLRVRLRTQVQRLQDDVRTGRLQRSEIELLRIVAVATSYGGQVTINSLERACDVPALPRTLELFEREYLFLRVSEDGTRVGALHPIRSRILSALLTVDAHPSWASIAARCLALLREEDLESFLLHAFSSKPGSSRVLLETIQDLELQTWKGVAGVVRALLWLGVHDYACENRDLIREVHARFGKSWVLVLDFDIGRVAAGRLDGLWQRLAGEGADAAIREYRARQTSTRNVYRHVSRWYESPKSRPAPPQSDLDWAGAAEVIFWAGYLQMQTPVVSWISSEELAAVVDKVSLDVLADVFLAASYASNEAFEPCRASLQGRLLTRFLRETASVTVEDDGTTICAHYVYPEMDGEATTRGPEQAADPLHAKSMRCVRLLRGLVPNRSNYGCRAYGHRMYYGADNDPSVKLIPRENLPPVWPVRLNALLSGVVEYEHRPPDWSAFARQLLDLRQVALAFLERVCTTVREHYARTSPVDPFRSSIDPAEWDESRRTLRNVPSLPKCAVDEWGFLSESLGQDPQAQSYHGTRASLQESQPETPQDTRVLLFRYFALAEYRSLHLAYSEFRRALSNFIDQAPKVIALNSTLGKAKKTAVRERVLALAKKQGISTSLPRVSVVNLAAILKVLESFQRVFRDRFSRFFEVRELATLEATEVERLNTAFDLWYHFAFHPGYPPKKRHRRKRGICEQTLVNFYKALNAQLRRLETSTRRAYLSPHRALWEQRPTPWIVIDSSDPLESMTSYDDVAVAVQTALEPSTNDLLKHFVCDAYCPVIMVVPLIQGHSLSMKAWKIQTCSLLQEKPFKPAWWHYVLHDVPVDAWRQLELSVLHSPGLETPAAVVAGLSALHMYVMHMHDLARVPESLRSDSDYLREYTERVLRTMSLVVEETRAAVSSMRKRTREYTQADLVSRLALGEIVTLLPAIEENARMPEDLCAKRPLDPGVLSDWSERLHTALSAAEMALLHWAADELHGAAD